MGPSLLSIPLELRLHIWSLIDLPAWGFQDSIGLSDRDIRIQPMINQKHNNYRFRLIKNHSKDSNIHPQALEILGKVCKQIRLEIASLVPNRLEMEGILAQAIFLVRGVDDLYVMSRSKPNFASRARHIRLATRFALGKSITEGEWSCFPRLRELEWVSVEAEKTNETRQIMEFMEDYKLHCTKMVGVRTIKCWNRPKKTASPCRAPLRRWTSFFDVLEWVSH